MNELDDEDKAAFKKAMSEVHPLQQKKIPATSKKSQRKTIKPSSALIIRPLRQHLPEKTKLPQVIKPQPYLPEVGPEETLSYKDASVNSLMWQRFRRGQLQVELRLDLHGLTLVEAEAKLEALLQHAHEKNVNQLLIIHGKGSHDNQTPPILKNWLWRWLRDYPQTLALHSAPKSQGGTGALLVWLKKHERPVHHSYHDKKV